ncbi:MAG: tetratricopeptide repeat protein [Candidatus Brocadiaceae bacterium]|nr:tetratricopeptide repeat protein [Candidatus Brocadiaceae bacterium]
MKHPRTRIVWFVLAAAVVGAAGFGLFRVVSRRPATGADAILAAYDGRAPVGGLAISYPLDETVFPPEIPAPTFEWTDEQSGADTWLVHVECTDGGEAVQALTHVPRWVPSDREWEAVKDRTCERDARVTVLGVRRASPNRIRSAASMTFRTSEHEVGAPLFYREINLPFIDAVKDPSLIRWRFADIADREPPVVLEGLPVCGNCHSFSADGRVLGMDVDYANDKGSYAIAEVRDEIVFDHGNIITWSDYDRQEDAVTFGLLSQVSPCGRYAVSTVKDWSVFVPTPGLEFSQLFFPVKGILVVYDRETQTFRALPGADDPRYVQSNPCWSPDGKHIVFARTEQYTLRAPRGKVLMTADDCREFLVEGKTFLFDLYRIPFNEGRGGVPEPLPGASRNGMSNYFARFSPDGRWIVFCKSRSFMLLQPDSELYIMPAEGGEPRRMRCNTSRMNSWHCWSPNGRWLVFSSKRNGPYTQLFLTHVDEDGNDSPPVLLAHLTAPDRAANIPEFVNASPTAIRAMREDFLDKESFLRAGAQLVQTGDYAMAESAFRRALQFDSADLDALVSLGLALTSQGRFEEGVEYLERALRQDPGSVEACTNLGAAFVDQGDIERGLQYYRRAAELAPDEARSHHNLALVLDMQGEHEEALAAFREALRRKPGYALVHNNYGIALARAGRLDEALTHHKTACELEPRSAAIRYNLGALLMRLGRSAEALPELQQTVGLDPAHAGAHAALAEIHCSQGRLDEALEHRRAVVKTQPKSASARHLLAVDLAAAGRLDDAAAEYREAIRLDAGHVDARFGLAALLRKQGKLDEALAQYEAALAIQTGDGAGAGLAPQ